jgi:hypothetical protein
MTQGQGKDEQSEARILLDVWLTCVEETAATLREALHDLGRNP